jgi:CheY-like chemotaxis protein
MPGMDGEQTTRAIKSDPAMEETQIIILTSMGQRGDAARLEALGCSAYLLKPVKQQMLFDAIIAVLSRVEDRATSLVTRHVLSEQRKLGLRLLLAEDNPINQKLAVVLLQKAGYSVDAVETGTEALEKVRVNPYAVPWTFKCPIWMVRSHSTNSGIGKDSRRAYTDHCHDRTCHAGRSRTLPRCRHG